MKFTNEQIKEELERRKRLVKEELSRREYKYYCSYTNNIKLGRHQELICKEIEDLIYRRVKHNILMVSLPPQHGKSLSITETLPSWYMGKFPDKRVIEVSYGDDLAVKFGSANKKKVEEFGHIFDIQLEGKANTDLSIKDHKGSMISRGITGGITGQPGDLIIVDDPFKNRQEADSPTTRNTVWNEFLNSIYSRLSADGVIIIVMTRWHEDDLVGRIMTNEIGQFAKYINIPCEAEEDDILGREPGEPLFPEIGKGKEWLERTKIAYMSQEGSRSWYALYQGRPTCLDGNIFKREWWQEYTRAPKMDQIILSVDATFKDNDDSDFVSIQAWGKSQADLYLLDLINKRMDFVSTIAAIKYMKKRHKVRSILIEDKANGTAILNVLKHSVDGLIPVKATESKIARALAVTPCIESGNVYLPTDGIFTYDGTTVTIHDYVKQLSEFPNGSNDDMVDSTTQAIKRLMYSDVREFEKHEFREDMDDIERYDNDIQDMLGGWN